MDHKKEQFSQNNGSKCSNSRPRDYTVSREQKLQFADNLVLVMCFVHEEFVNNWGSGGKIDTLPRCLPTETWDQGLHI